MVMGSLIMFVLLGDVGTMLRNGYELFGVVFVFCGFV